MAICVYMSLVILTPLAAQNSVSAEDVFFDDNLGKVIRMKTLGKGEFQGALYRITDEVIELVDGEGQIIQILRSEIIDVVVMDPEMKKSAYYQDAAANRLIVMPTGFGMDAGEFHVAIQEIVAVTASYGVSENFSLWGGISIPGGVLNARYSLELGDFGALSVGTFAGFLWGWLGSAIYMPYGILSIGSEVQNVTVGVAALGTLDSPYSHGICVPIAGKLVISRSAALITENWFVITKNEYLGYPFNFGGYSMMVFPSAVFRIAGSRSSWDIGVTLPIGLYSFIPIPLLSFTYRIN